MKLTRKLALCAVLTALALALSYFERLLPLQLLVPLPGVKLGLANIVSLFALCFLGPWPALTVLLARCFLGSLFAGSLSGLLFSLAGGLLALLCMALARRSRLSVYGVSVCGAAAHNLGQIGAAVVVMRTAAVVNYLPGLLLAAIVSGLLTGAAAAGVFRAFGRDAQLRRMIEGSKR